MSPSLLDTDSLLARLALIVVAVVFDRCDAGVNLALIVADPRASRLIAPASIQKRCTRRQSIMLQAPTMDAVVPSLSSLCFSSIDHC